MNSKFECILLMLIIASTLLRTGKSNVCRIDSCFPPNWDLETIRGANISANSTCGLTEDEGYCVKQKCDFKCNNAVPSKYHGVNLTVDTVDDDTYWKSKNLDENVFVELDLGHSYFFVEITATFAFSYPAAMYFSKSDDHGATWHTLAYFSSDCGKYFNMTAVEENDRDGLIVQCFRLDRANTDLKASYQPWRDQQFAENIHKNYSLQQEFLASNFRMVLVKFETPPDFSLDRADERNFYFAVKDWYIRGSCYCHGQSAECNKEESWKCNCLKNTTGENCQECLPLFNNEKYESGEACTECQCNNHSSRCEYSQTKGYGVCQNCTGYTTGDYCDKCLPFYYEALLPDEHPDRCQACNCHPSGITGEPGSDICDQATGQCECKANVTGRTCGECKNEYWNLRKDNPYGCQKCVCELAGTGGSNVCDKKTGQCPCREHLVGLKCTECENGYYGLTYGNPSPCKDCSCSAVGSLNITCDQTTGDCYCRQKFSGPNCTVLQAGFYVPGVPEVTYEAEQTGSVVYRDKTSGITGVLIDGTSDSRTVVFNVDIPKTSVYSLVVRYQTSVEWKDATLKVESLLAPFTPYSCNGKAPVTNQSFTLTATVSSFSTAVNFGDNCLVKGPYTMTLELPLLALGRSRAILSTEALIDSLVVLPSVKNISYPKAGNKTLFYYEQAFSRQSWSRNKDEIQKSLAPYFSLIYDGGKACSCNDTGSVNISCDKDGGQCRCKPNVGGLNCDTCKPTFYGFSETGCQGCDCNPVGSNSTLCDPVTGQCECKEGVIGKQCTQCKANYYGFNSSTGCLPCLCDQNYSRNLQCNSNGICDCLPGVQAPKCHGCNDTSFNLTTQGCDGCHCDIHGSASLTCNKFSGKCPCKTLVVGQKCDSCLTGFYYGLDSYHPTGCLKCQCSGKTMNCSSKPDMYEANVTTDLNALSPTDMTRFQNWTTTGGTGLSAGFDIDIDGDARGIIEVNVNTKEVIYFAAPSKFLGDKRTAYQHRLSFYLKQTDPNNPFDTAQGDVIIKGKWFNESLVHKFDKIPGDEFSQFSVFFGESEQWKVGNANGRNATSYEVVAVLSELEELLIRAKWSNTTGATTSIAKIAMYLSKEYENGSQIPAGARMTQSVESCDCPREFAGDSCERCAEGYTREVPNSGPYTKCVPCSCHGNSDRCDPNTGICIDCKHNTTGDYCERCAVGYYGNATFGSQHACQACSCYGGHNSCDLTPDGSFVCNCKVGYEGGRCERCADGYFGIPTELNGNCSVCECNGNARTCNRTTGDCSPYCQFNSAGSKCESCRDGFFGDATKQNCRDCNCSTNGSVTSICDKNTGKCACLSNIEGRTCSRCKHGAWDYGNETGCKLCECFEDGSRSLQCDLTTGVCSCKVNVTGTKCDRCVDGLYGVSLGCVGCDCNMTYSNNSICDPRNGQCECKKSSAGGFYGGRQCTECRWDTVGSFPTCAQCNETCYENWYKLIQEERNKVAVLAENVTNILQTFNGTSVKDINETLSDLNTKLNKSEKIFEGAKFDTESKEEQYRKINESLVDLKQKLDRANESLTEILSYLVAVVAPFDGTVHVDSTTPPVQANYTTIRNWADRILQEIEANNKTAHQNFEKILSLYEQIEQYNSSSAKAVEEVKQSVARLDNITTKLDEASSILSQDFYDNVRTNDQTLEKLSQDSEEISRLVNDSALLSNAASVMLDRAESNITEAQKEADSNSRESLAAYNDSIQAERKSYEARNISDEFKTNSSTLLTQVENAITEVKTNIDNMAHARANLGNATEIAGKVLGITIPVEEQTINAISQHILSINVDEALVNATFGNATAGLKTAVDAQRLAERAKNISNITLQQVKEIERKIVEAHERREEARKLQNSTDHMVSEIKRITSEVENEYSDAKKIGETTLSLLNTTIKEIDDSLKCFNESKQLALDANTVANLAYRQILNASKIHNESETTLRDIESSLNTSYTIAMTSYHSIIQTHQNATSLYEEVREAEDLLKSFIKQRDEMNALKNEVTLLETQLDSLNKDLDEKLKEYESCHGGG